MARLRARSESCGARAFARRLARGRERECGADVATGHMRIERLRRQRHAHEHRKSQRRQVAGGVRPDEIADQPGRPGESVAGQYDADGARDRSRTEPAAQYRVRVDVRSKEVRRGVLPVSLGRASHRFIAGIAGAARDHLRGRPLSRDACGRGALRHDDRRPKHQSDHYFAGTGVTVSNSRPPPATLPLTVVLPVSLMRASQAARASPSGCNLQRARAFCS